MKLLQRRNKRCEGSAADSSARMSEWVNETERQGCSWSFYPTKWERLLLWCYLSRRRSFVHVGASVFVCSAFVTRGHMGARLHIAQSGCASRAFASYGDEHARLTCMRSWFSRVRDGDVEDAKWNGPTCVIYCTQSTIIFGFSRIGRLCEFVGSVVYDLCVHTTCLCMYAPSTGNVCFAVITQACAGAGLCLVLFCAVLCCIRVLMILCVYVRNTRLCGAFSRIKRTPTICVDNVCLVYECLRECLLEHILYVLRRAERE